MVIILLYTGPVPVISFVQWPSGQGGTDLKAQLSEWEAMGSKPIAGISKIGFSGRNTNGFPYPKMFLLLLCTEQDCLVAKL